MRFSLFFPTFPIMSIYADFGFLLDTDVFRLSIVLDIVLNKVYEMFYNFHEVLSVYL